MECVPTNKHTIFGIDISVHVLILFTILSWFFMLYTAKLEKKALNDRLKDNISYTIDNFLNSLTIVQKQELKKINNSPNITALREVLKQPDQNTDTNNKWLFRTIIYTNVTLLVLVTLVTVLLMTQCDKCIDIKHILLVNFITFVFVGGFEYLFFKNVGFKYSPSMPSTISNTFTSRIGQNMSNI
jgi:hypothetical protein